jgi:SPP1 gp7 family putative phage head morphogenesis protein
MRTFKSQVAAGEKEQLAQMTRAWLSVERRLDGQMTALAYEMTAIREAGGTVTPTMLATNRRYQELMIQLRSELDNYTDYADREITARQAELIPMGISHSTQAIVAQGVTTSFNRLPISAVEHMVGLAGNGSPLRTLLEASWPLAAQGMTQELVNGVALGWNPRKTAKAMAQGATGSLNRMMTIARSEQLRVYRESSLSTYRESQVVIGHTRLATFDNRVCASCLMDSGTFYPLDEHFPTHPNCRCVSIPVCVGVPAPVMQSGEDWFMDQPSATQENILGPGTYDAWRLGQFELSELITVKPNVTWGDTIQTTPLRELVQ